MKIFTSTPVVDACFGPGFAPFTGGPVERPRVFAARTLPTHGIPRPETVMT